MKDGGLTKGIIGAVIGDIAGSAHEFSDDVRPSFRLFTSKSSFTDDTALTMAVSEWLLSGGSLTIDDALLKWGRTYPHAGYGRGFKAFLKAGKRNAKGSTHNGGAMRVSPVGFLAGTLDEALSLARESALPSHDTPGAIAGSQAVASAIYLARTGSAKEEICSFLESRFGYDLHRTYEEVRSDVQARLAMRETEHERAHELLLSARTTVPDAVTAFLAADGFESAVRLAVCLGADADTYAAMAGGIAAAFWGVPDGLVRQALPYLPPDMIGVINAVDGTSWQPTGITPPNTHRWRSDDVVVYGSNADGTEGENGFWDVHPSRFHRHLNAGYRIVTIGRTLQEIGEQVEALRRETEANPERRYLVREVGVSKAGYTAGQIAPLFRWAAGSDNVLLPRSFMELL